VDTTRPSLLLRIRDRGDAGAWRTFDAIYRPMLYRFALARGLPPVEADELAQQCLTVVADHIGEFSYDPQKGRFKSWLRTLVNNRIRNRARDEREQQARTHDFEAAPQQRETPPDEEIGKIWMEEHRRHCLRELRNEVEESTFQGFQHYVIDEWPLERVCAELNVKPNNVYTIKWRLTERVAARMRELLDGTE